MGSLKKLLVMLAVAFAVIGTANLALAHCGSCGVTADDHDHDHDQKVECVKCAHEKVCSSEDCDNPAHDAPCTCPDEEYEDE
jgi:hypothetical protein